MTFSDLNLNKPLLNALNDLGYQYPTTIQAKAFSVIMSGRDVCGIAQTGTGKTFAYLLPCLRQWQFAKDRFPQILIMVPTRELVVQVVDEVKKLTTYMNTVVIGAYGGANIKTQIAEIYTGVDVVVATPGRLFDLILNGALKLKALKKLVIDEVDEMLNLGFRHQLTNILDLLPAKRQSLLFSATISDDVEKLMQVFFNNPIRIDAVPVGTPLENIVQTAYHVPNFNTKVNLLKLLLSNDATLTKVLVFASTKQMVDDIHQQLYNKFSDQIGVIHSNKSQNYRFNSVEQFKNGTYRVLIATDIIARGIDISEVTHVINFDTPEIPETYIHRIGRTGRIDKQGISITFITKKEKESKKKIESLMKYKIKLLPLPNDLEISEVLTQDEMPKINMKTIQIKNPKIDLENSAFHEKKEKNKKVNMKVTRADQMKLKYGKPKTRGQKKK